MGRILDNNNGVADTTTEATDAFLIAKTLRDGHIAQSDLFNQIETIPNIADAITKKHTQNTDTGKG